MLVLSRRIGEKIMIGDDIVLTIVDIDHNYKVRIGVEAPRSVLVFREELLPPEHPQSAKQPQ